MLSSDHTSLHFKAMKDEIAYPLSGKKFLLSELLHKLAPKVATRLRRPRLALRDESHHSRDAVPLQSFPASKRGGLDFFGSSPTKRTAAFMEECDKERLAIGKALGLSASASSCHAELLPGTRAETLYEALS